MAKRNLSPEIVSLIHHVELNQSGWWKKAAGQVIKGVLWKINKPLTMVEIRAQIKREIGIDISDAVLEKQIGDLLSVQEMQKLNGDVFKLSEQTFSALSRAHDAAVKEQEACKDFFILSISQLCPSLDAQDVWNKFSKALINAVRVVGANTYNLLANGKLEQESDWLSKFIGQFADDQRDGLRNVLVKFLSPNNQVCRAQILRLMAAHFFAEATQLNQATIDAIDAKRSKRTIRLLLDTNFVFSILGLHDNPANDSALSLLDIAKENSKFIDIKLNVLPQTVEETQAAIAAQLHQIENIRYSSAMFSAARQAHLPSIAASYFAAAQKSNGISAQEFLRPYIEDLKTILKSKGIDVIDAQPGVYHQRQDVIDDINDELNQEKSRRDDQQKSYETIRHDVVLWHVVNDRRKGSEESPLDIETWAVSLDWRLIKFDQRKQGKDGTRPPIVLYPTNLIQLIQFWIPRSEELESSLIDSLRLPLFFQQFDPEDERVTIKILEVISRYENVDDLSENTVGNLLANKALRGRIKEIKPDAPEVVDLIQAEFVAENKRVLEQLNQTQMELLNATNAARIAEENALSERSRRITEEGARSALETQLETEEAHKKSVVSELEELRGYTQQLSHQIKEVQDAQTRRSFIIWYVGVPLFIAFASGALMWHLLPSFKSDVSTITKFLTSSAITTLVAGVGLYFAKSKLDKLTAISEWWVGKAINFVHQKVLIGGGGLAITAILQGGVWDGVKALLGD